MGRFYRRSARELRSVEDVAGCNQETGRGRQYPVCQDRCSQPNYRTTAKCFFLTITVISREQIDRLQRRVAGRQIVKDHVGGVELDLELVDGRGPLQHVCTTYRRS